MKTSYSESEAQAPTIPDHEVLKLIGKGSYGQVWLARAVTGALRAVKVVRRSDFEFDRTFEREFEGIKKFEPISRDHPGLVAVLHVGRNLSEGFYYYVMELADDRLTGAEIVPELYVPHTLSSDVKKKGRLEMDECLRCGSVMADALHHMHRLGLSHRDVKPSNVIFVDGGPKLADIGLVAASGQRTFVGTEGFVPPEGPGSPQADIYSLGMVLYEISTGKDRMDFPEVPSDFENDTERRKWRQLNEVMCTACAPSPKQRFGSAREMRQALDRVKALRFKATPLWVKALRVMLLSGLLGLFVTVSRNAPLLQAFDESKKLIAAQMAAAPSTSGSVTQPPNVPEPPPEPPEPPVEPPPEPPPTTGVVRVISTPPGAKVYVNGDYWGQTPITRGDLPPGEVEFRLEKEGHKTIKFLDTVEVGKIPKIVGGQELEFWAPPVAEQNWTNSLQMDFRWKEDRHVALRAITEPEYLMFLKDVEKRYPAHTATITSANPLIDTKEPVVLVSRATATAFCDWLTDRDRAAGYLTDTHTCEFNEDIDYDVESATLLGGASESLAIFCAVSKQLYGAVKIDSKPEQGAGVYIRGEYQGATPLKLSDLKPGKLELLVKKRGFKKKMVEARVSADEEESLVVELETSNEVVFGEEWENGLGMKFVPVGDIMFSVWETRVTDFAVYESEVEIAEPRDAPPFKQGDLHPVIEVSWTDARDFCRWLTEREREAELIGPGDVYRLPTDLEWSFAVGLEGEGGANPAARDGQIKDRYLWNGPWPPPEKSDNYADRSASGKLGPGNIIQSYRDGFPDTAPVGSFKANKYGLYDMGGNVSEWVEDLYGGVSRARTWAVLRGGCYATQNREQLLSSYRNPIASDWRGVLYGFRCVLAKEVPPVAEEVKMPDPSTD